MGKKVSEMRYGLAKKTSLTGFLISVLIFYRSPNLLEFAGFTIYFTTVSALAGLSWRNIDGRAFRFVVLIVLAVAAVFPLFFTGLTTSCMGYFPYTAENTFTGECHKFFYGGCGDRPHPWFYEEGCGSESLEEFCKEDQAHDIRSCYEKGYRNGSMGPNIR